MDNVTLRLNGVHNIQLDLVPDTNMYLGLGFDPDNMGKPDVISNKITAGDT